LLLVNKYRVHWFLFMTAHSGHTSQRRNKHTMGTSPELIEAEEYAVYSILIESWYVHNNIRLIVIEDHSKVDSLVEGLDNRLDPLMEELPDVKKELIDDFKIRNIQSVPLKPLISLHVPSLLIRNNEIEDIFQTDGDGWEEFYQRYPNSPGIITLSRVGFNPYMDQALVYIGNQSHWRAGSGHFVLLRKENDMWKVQDNIMIWIS
jgi:hypothetical protein